MYGSVPRRAPSRVSLGTRTSVDGDTAIDVVVRTFVVGVTFGTVVDGTSDGAFVVVGATSWSSPARRWSSPPHRCGCRGRNRRRCRRPVVVVTGATVVVVVGAVVVVTGATVVVVTGAIVVVVTGATVVSSARPSSSSTGRNRGRRRRDGCGCRTDTEPAAADVEVPVAHDRLGQELPVQIRGVPEIGLGVEVPELAPRLGVMSERDRPLIRVERRVTVYRELRGARVARDAVLLLKSILFAMCITSAGSVSIVVNFPVVNLHAS